MSISFVKNSRFEREIMNFVIREFFDNYFITYGHFGVLMSFQVFCPYARYNDGVKSELVKILCPVG
jgi:hypothetical protein